MAIESLFPAWRYDYTSRYATLGGTIEDERPWDITKEIGAHFPEGGVYVDIGCGGCSKIIPLDGKGGIIIGIDHSAKILPKASANIQHAGAKHTVLIQGDGKHLPLPDNCADVVSNIMSPHFAPEVERVLKPGGVFVIERVGESDKRDVKALFGVGADGQARGYRSGEHSRAVVYSHINDLHNAGFCVVTIFDGFWDTFYTPDGFRDLLRHTPTINNYDEEKDKPIVDFIIKTLQTKKGIPTRQHRMFIIARKPDDPSCVYDFHNQERHALTFSAYDQEVGISPAERIHRAVTEKKGVVCGQYCTHWINPNNLS